MQKQISIRLKPSEAADTGIIYQYIAAAVAHPVQEISGFSIIKESLDARGRQVWINLSLTAFINEPFNKTPPEVFRSGNVTSAAKRVVVIGAGPAGLFAALSLMEKGIKPIVLERGKEVRARRRDLALLNKEGIINPESNYCFGEGGAGTFSDGKLYTRSNKRGSIARILNMLVHFGADEKILYQAHPHIGTNKLPQIITAMRQHILDCGGEFLFEQKVTDFAVDKGCIRSVITAGGQRFDADAFVLATGHSARDIFLLLQNKQILIEAKPFALGVRIEHPQVLIDSIQYKCGISPGRGPYLPPASYSLVQQVQGRGVFSFCMCPGGIIAPAATSAGELVVNGWSPSKRNNPRANSGMVVEIKAPDWAVNGNTAAAALGAMYFQQAVEQKAYAAGGGKFVAPALRMTDFADKKLSATLPACSYQPGITAAPLHEVLPPFVYSSLAAAFTEFGRKMRGYYTSEAVVVATESRTSSPVKIPRLPDRLCHPQISNLYPCGEGGGYAGGIISAAMDGERVALQLAGVLKQVY